jgi:Mis12 protein
MPVSKQSCLQTLYCAACSFQELWFGFFFFRNFWREKKIQKNKNQTFESKKKMAALFEHADDPEEWYKEEAEYFGFHPLAFVDRVKEIAERNCEGVLEALERELHRALQDEQKQSTVRQGASRMLSRVMASRERQFDKFELYVLNNVFRMPEQWQELKQKKVSEQSVETQSNDSASSSSSSSSSSSKDNAIIQLAKEIERVEREEALRLELEAAKDAAHARPLVGAADVVAKLDAIDEQALDADIDELNRRLAVAQRVSESLKRAVRSFAQRQRVDVALDEQLERVAKLSASAPLNGTPISALVPQLEQLAEQYTQLAIASRQQLQGTALSFDGDDEQVQQEEVAIDDDDDEKEESLIAVVEVMMPPKSPGYQRQMDMFMRHWHDAGRVTSSDLQSLLSVMVQ